MKKTFNRKGVLIAISLLFVMVIIGVTSFANAGIDPNYWKSDKFVTNTIFTVSLVLIGVVSGQAEGDNFYRNKVDGLFVASYNGYNTKRASIENLVDKFSDWAYNLYKKEQYKKIVRYLRDENGIKQFELILELDKEQVITLESGPKSFIIGDKERYLNSLSREQIKAILRVFNGEIKVRYVDDSYYLNAYAKNKNKTMYEQASEQEKKKKQKFAFLMMYRVIFTVLTGMVFTAFVIEQKTSGEETAQAVLNLFSRYFTLFTSFTWGFFLSNDMIKDECIFLDYKTTTLTQFYLDVEVNKTFICKTEEEKAYEKIISMQEKKKEEINNDRINDYSSN